MNNNNYQKYLLESPIIRGKGVYLFTKNKKKYFDSTGGMTGSITLGWGNKKIENSIYKQLKNIANIDYKSFKDQNREILIDEFTGKEAIADRLNKLKIDYSHLELNKITNDIKKGNNSKPLSDIELLNFV